MLYSLLFKEYNGKTKKALAIFKPNYKISYLFPSLRLSYAEASFSFPPFFSCSFSFFFLFSGATLIALSVSTSTTSVGRGCSFSLSLVRVEGEVEASWVEEEVGVKLGSEEG